VAGINVVIAGLVFASGENTKNWDVFWNFCKANIPAMQREIKDLVFVVDRFGRNLARVAAMGFHVRPCSVHLMENCKLLVRVP
jgi:hypothetical protein